MLLGLILSATGIVLFAWAMFRLAVFALPVGLGAAAFLWAGGGELGPLLGLLLGLVVGVAVLLIGRMLIASRLPVPLRGAIALLFAVPAGIAGGSVVSSLMQLGGAGPTATGIAAAPGTRFQYGPTPLQIFGEVMRRKLKATGQNPDPQEYLDRRLLVPLGVRTGEWRKGADGKPLMPQGLVLAASEWAKIGEFVRAGGKQDGKPLVDPVAFADLFEGSSVNPAYGLTWWLPRPSLSNDPVTRATDITEHSTELPADMVVAAGAGDQRLYVIPSRRLTIVRQAKLDIMALAAGKKSGWSDTRFLELLLAD